MNAQEIRELLNYNPDTGILTMRIRTSRRVKIGDIAGTIKPGGYIDIKIKGRLYKAHRLAWLHAYGSWPKGDIDHINHDGGDNRIINLRDVTCLENMRNQSIYRNNKSGIHGVDWENPCKKWRARITAGRKEIYLGQHIDFFEACCARKSAENKYGFHKNHGAAKL